jgi:hypothetical protein
MRNVSRDIIKELRGMALYASGGEVFLKVEYFAILDLNAIEYTKCPQPLNIYSTHRNWRKYSTSWITSRASV